MTTVNTENEAQRVGNTAKIREALEGCAEVAKKDMAHYMYANTIGEHNAIKVWSSLIGGFCDRALAAPPRNCDVGTPDEQAERFKAFCLPRVGKCCEAGTCPAHHPVNQCGIQYCQLIWAQLPYEAPATLEKGCEE